MSEAPRKVRFGMVGGGRGAFIGPVHRIALALDGQGELIAGALSSTPERALSSAQAIGLHPDRSYESWQNMLTVESAREPADRIDAVSIVTPNNTHREIACAFLDAGFHVVLDKPMVCDAREAEQLRESVALSKATLTVTYNYSGYPLVREARSIVSSGALGAIRKMFVRYHQGWLSNDIESSGHKQASWRTNPETTGGAGALGDIGTHAEHLVHFITGLEPSELCADVRTFVSGRCVDDDASVLLRYPNGRLWCADVFTGLLRRRERAHHPDLWRAGLSFLGSGRTQPASASRRNRCAPGYHPRARSSQSRSPSLNTHTTRPSRGIPRSLRQHLLGRDRPRPRCKQCARPSRAWCR